MAIETSRRTAHNACLAFRDETYSDAGGAVFNDYSGSHTVTASYGGAAGLAADSYAAEHDEVIAGPEAAGGVG